MRLDPLDVVLSEKHALDELLEELPESCVVERFSLKARLEEVNAEIARLRSLPSRRPFPVTFRGGPVDGTRAIDAGFAGKALAGLIDAVDTVAASFISNLKATGPIPSVGARGLQVVGTATGSFGFELELPPEVRPSDRQPELALGEGFAAPQPEDPYAKAIGTTLALLDKAHRRDDDAISDLIAEVHPRAAAKIHAFAEVLVKHDAGFSAAFAGHTVTLAAGEDALRVTQALRGEDIAEREEQVDGTLTGVLPASRRFECRLADGRVLQGTVDRLVDVEALKAFSVDRPGRLVFRVVKVRARERHVLLGAGPLA
jgi:hypothetical protein